MKQKRLADFADWLDELGPIEIQLSAYRRSGMCWSKVGEFTVSDAMRKDLDLNPLAPDTQCPACKNWHSPHCGAQ